MSNVAAGALSATSTDAVNGGQLYATNQTVAALTNGTSGLVQQSGGAPGSGTLTVGAATGGTTVDFTSTSGPRVLTGVASGSTAAGSKDAVNGGQLNTGLASVATGLGGGAVYDPVTGKVTAPSYSVGGTAYNNVGGAIGALDTGLANVAASVASLPIKGNNTSSLANPVATGADATAVGFGAQSTGANSVALGAGSTDGGQANVVSVGAVGAERKVVNVAAGTLSATSTDAVNGSQLNATNTQVATLGHASVQYATAPSGSTTSAIDLASDAGGPVIIHNLAPGVVATDAANVGQVQAVAALANNGVQYDKNPDGSKANTVTLAGGTTGAPVTLQNVAAGVKATDAVNLGQLQGSAAGTLAAANTYTDQRVSNLAALTSQGIADAKTLAKNGTALALAGTGLRYDDRPGKTSVTGATAYYKGTMGMAFGLGHTSSDSAWRYNVSVNGTPWADKPEIGVVVGASYTFK